MRRLLPFLIFVLITGGLVAFIYKDRIFPQPQEGANGNSQSTQAGRGGGRRGGGGFRRAANQPVPVTADKARTENVPVFLSGVGTVQAYNTTTVRAQVSGRLIEVNFREGQDVKAGDVLAKIDPVLFQAIYDQTVAQKAKDEANLANARLDAQRFTNLVKTNSASQQQADTAVANVRQLEAQVKQDQASIDNAKANLNYTTILAPINGRTGLRLIDVGNLVSSSDATGIVVITQLKPISVVFTLPEDNLPQVLDEQSKGRLPLQAITGGQTIAEGALEVIDNQIDQTTGTVRLKGTFPNETNRLWPGQFVNIKLKLKTLDNVVVVPSVAVQQGANGSYVYLASPDNTAKLTNVKVTQEGERLAVIAEGVKADDTVITSGFASLQDGSKIRTENPAVGAGATQTQPQAQQGAPGASQGHRRRHQTEASAEDPERGSGHKRGATDNSGQTADAPSAQGHQSGVARP